MSSPAPGLSPVAARAPARGYGFSCLICRRRKIKCDGIKPTCTNCTKYKENCVYRENPFFVTYLGDELRKANIRIRELENEIKELAAQSTERRTASLGPGVNKPTSSVPACVESDEPHGTLPESYGGSAEYSIDENGRQQYFGATSRFHTLSDDSDRQPSETDTATERSDSEVEEYHRKWHISNSRFQASWEKQAYENIPKYTDVDVSLCSRLLQVFWTWQGPLHNSVYRPCFFRDMALNGPYFSLFLLNVIFAHACRHMPDDDPRFKRFDKGEFFMRKAMLLLLDEMKAVKTRIPTIQGLLILGGRQCAVGKSSEGWLYTGMAFRMMTDLGLQLRKGKNATKECEPDDLEVRKRLYLSGYAWDKSISLCLGRLPSLTQLPYSPSSLFDTSDDNDQWQPPLILQTDKTFPPTKCHSTLTFTYFCQLAQIINESYNTVYNGNSVTPQNIKPETIFDLEKKLQNFHRTLPDCLRIQDTPDLTSCVPPHIIILYHTMLILIFRPFFIWCWHAHLREHPLALRAQAVCTEQAVAVNEIFRAYGRLFHFQYQTYLVSYCVYTAATIDVRLMRHEDRILAERAADRLVVQLRMLETEVKQTPGIKRSIDIIRSHLGQQRLPVLNDPSRDITNNGAHILQGQGKSRHTQKRQEDNIGQGYDGISPPPAYIAPSYMSSSSSSGMQQHLHQTTHLQPHNELYNPALQQDNYPTVAMEVSGMSNTTVNTINMHPFTETNMQHMEMPWFDVNVDNVNVDNSSGGFVSDMASWWAM